MSDTPITRRELDEAMAGAHQQNTNAISELRAAIESLATRVDLCATRVELCATRDELRAEILATRVDLRAEILKSEARLQAFVANEIRNSANANLEAMRGEIRVATNGMVEDIAGRLTGLVEISRPSRASQ
jgi:hypothetical protein